MTQQAFQTTPIIERMRWFYCEKHGPSPIVIERQWMLVLECGCAYSFSDCEPMRLLGSTNPSDERATPARLKVETVDTDGNWGKRPR